jgi:hypothetical protein
MQNIKNWTCILVGDDKKANFWMAFSYLISLAECEVRHTHYQTSLNGQRMRKACLLSYFATCDHGSQRCSNDGGRNTVLRCCRGMGVLGLPTWDLQQLDWSVSLPAPKGLGVCPPPSHSDNDGRNLAVLNEASPCGVWNGVSIGLEDPFQPFGRQEALHDRVLQARGT